MLACASLIWGFTVLVSEAGHLGCPQLVKQLVRTQNNMGEDLPVKLTSNKKIHGNLVPASQEGVLPSIASERLSDGETVQPPDGGVREPGLCLELEFHPILHPVTLHIVLIHL